MIYNIIYNMRREVSYLPIKMKKCAKENCGNEALARIIRTRNLIWKKFTIYVIHRRTKKKFPRDYREHEI